MRAWQDNASLKVVSKAEVLREMAEPIEDLSRPKHRGNRARPDLVEQGMVEVAGDQIIVPARFQQVNKAG